jgi:hypothetical protein
VWLSFHVAVMAMLVLLTEAMVDRVEGKGKVEKGRMVSRAYAHTKIHLRRFQSDLIVLNVLCLDISTGIVTIVLSMYQYYIWDELIYYLFYQFFLLCSTLHTLTSTC